MDKVSDIRKVNQLSKLIYKKPVETSTRKNKKYMILNDDNKYVHFGDSRYEDFTQHKNKDRQQNYLKRSSNIKGNWKNNKYSPNNLSMNILWK
jgi:hypothetical protein